MYISNVNNKDNNMAKIKGVKIGENVWWVDPDRGISSGWYEVVLIDGYNNPQVIEEVIHDEHFSWEDSIIGIENKYGSYAEVTLNELRFVKSKSRRKDA